MSNIKALFSDNDNLLLIYALHESSGQCESAKSRSVAGVEQWVRSLRTWEIGKINALGAHFLEVLLFQIEIFYVWPLCNFTFLGTI